MEAHTSDSASFMLSADRFVDQISVDGGCQTKAAGEVTEYKSQESFGVFVFAGFGDQ